MKHHLAETELLHKFTGDDEIKEEKRNTCCTLYND